VGLGVTGPVTVTEREELHLLPNPAAKSSTFLLEQVVERRHALVFQDVPEALITAHAKIDVILLLNSPSMSVTTFLTQSAVLIT
jgi:hypothetical protein